MNSPKTSLDKEYVLDTSVLASARLDYATTNTGDDPRSIEEYQRIQDACFNTLLELSAATILLDLDGEISAEYQNKVLNDDPKGFPAQWISRMTATGRIRYHRVEYDSSIRSHLRSHFNLSKVDCCGIFLARHASTKTILHRESGMNNASGYIKGKLTVTAKHVMK